MYSNNKKLYRLLLIAAIVVFIIEGCVYLFVRESKIYVHENKSISNNVKNKVSASNDTDLPNKPIERPVDKNSTEEEITTEEEIASYKLSNDYQTTKGYFDGDSLICNYDYVKSPSCGMCDDGVVYAIVNWKGRSYKAIGNANSHFFDLKILKGNKKNGSLLVYGNNAEGYEGIILHLRGKDYGEYRRYYENE